MHSYWDDFWALRGFKDAAFAARLVGAPQAARRWARVRDAFRADLIASLGAAMVGHDIAYLPGAAELGDFDPASTAIALSPVDELASLPRAAVRQTFERYYAQFQAREDGSAVWERFTPYEVRIGGALLRLGEPERARVLLGAMLEAQRPLGWQEWPEVVWHDARRPAFFGDLPHAWVAAEFIRSALDLFAFERESDSALVVGAGIAPEWVTATPGVAVRDLRTAYGALSFSMTADGDRVRVRLEGSLDPPPGGVVVHAPLAAPLRSVVVNGVSRDAGTTGEVTIRALPAEIVFGY